MINTITNVSLGSDGWLEISMQKEDVCEDLQEGYVGTTLYNRELFLDKVINEPKDSGLIKSTIIRPIYVEEEKVATLPQKIKDSESSKDYFTKIYKLINGYSELARNQLAFDKLTKNNNQ